MSLTNDGNNVRPQSMTMALVDRLSVCVFDLGPKLGDSELLVNLYVDKVQTVKI